MICTKVHINVLVYCTKVPHTIHNVHIKVNKLELVYSQLNAKKEGIHQEYTNYKSTYVNAYFTYPCASSYKYISRMSSIHTS